MTIQQSINYANERYTDRLRMEERRVPQMAEDVRRPVTVGARGRKLGDWLASRAHGRLHLRAAPRRGEQPAG
jgi:hypothetical protein